MKKVLASVVLSAALVAPGVSAYAAPNTNELNSYLKSISLTQAQLNDYLQSYYGESISDFDSVAELKETLGERLTQKTLDAVLEENGYTEKEVIDLAVYYDDMDKNASLLDTYYFTSDIENLIYLDQDESGSSEDEFPSMDDLSDVFSAFGITEAELNNLSSYLEKVVNDDPAIEAKLEALADRASALEENYPEFFSMDTEATPEELPDALKVELMNIVKELQSTLKIDIKVQIEQKGVKSPLTFAKLLTMDDSMDSMEDLKVYLEIYDNAGNLLLDALFTPDALLGDDQLVNIVKDTQKAVKTSEKKPTVTVRTENGGKLPTTATHTTEWTMVGMLMMLAAVVLRKKVIAKR
ncbi:MULTISPECIES: processed acidic surface protein [unclassified Bacillus (in: firmicutes)]|uniref:processed acidic surface protein n=1 Tax=unclassified Bacillus (in: firmicutes) TaxID=185979 RepID=UPI000BEF34F0|nr:MULTISPECIES: processed acidic surface protein [unclassified Bacillus (in: firmicutes)]PEL11127.1 processed acidic surface protein [Bacillus sp. AFS017336]